MPGTKKVTLVHSRASFLQLFSPELGEKAEARLRELGVEVVMGERVQGLPSSEEERAWLGEGDGRAKKAVTLSDGRVVEYDLLLRCTGQKPNSGPFATLLPQSVQKDGYIRVKDTVQVDAGPDTEPWTGRVFVAGDVADAGVIKVSGAPGNFWGQCSSEVLTWVGSPSRRLGTLAGTRASSRRRTSSSTFARRQARPMTSSLPNTQSPHLRSSSPSDS